MRIAGLEIKLAKPKKRAYEAADRGRRGKTYRLAGSTGANKEVAGALPIIRDRARHLVRNNGWAARAVNAVVRHTVGEGIQPAPEGTLDYTADVKRLWKKWATSTNCDWYGKTTFYGLQELAMRSIVEGGEVIILRRIVDSKKNGGIPLKLQLLEGDHLDHSRNETNEKGYVRMGVQFNKDHEIIGYWLFDYHPGDNVLYTENVQSMYVEKRDVIHAYELLRIGQLRGLPFGVASFMKMADFSDYEDAQLVKQKIAACFAAFVVGSEDTSTDPRELIEPGAIEHISEAERVEFASPPTVGDYEKYTARILQGIAAAFGITYEMIAMDYSNVNFTSGRMAKIDVTENFKSWQYKLIVPQICAPAWEWFVDACIIAGLLHHRVAADWTAPRVQQLDPVKETNAQILKIQAGLATWSETIRETGREPEEFALEYQSDKERFDKLGISLSCFDKPDKSDNNEQDKSKDDTGSI